MTEENVKKENKDLAEQPVNNTETVTEEPTVEDMEHGIGSANKIAVPDILKQSFGKHGEYVIKTPLRFAQIAVNASYINKLYPETAIMDLLFIKETLEHSTGEKRTQEVLEATKYELEHQHDIDKAKARSTIQQ